MLRFVQAWMGKGKKNVGRKGGKVGKKRLQARQRWLTNSLPPSLRELTESMAGGVLGLRKRLSTRRKERNGLNRAHLRVSENMDDSNPERQWKRWTQQTEFWVSWVPENRNAALRVARITERLVVAYWSWSDIAKRTTVITQFARADEWR